MSKKDDLFIQQIKCSTYEEANKLLKEHDKELKDKAYKEGYDKGYDDYDPDGWTM